jgi:DNA mismatch repair protein MLH1
VEIQPIKFEKLQQMQTTPIIKQLSKEVVNKIAAGEVIQYPVNALKELVENSLDAKSTQITIIVQDAGLKFLQISDDGVGISKSDLINACERHWTSKITDFDDLKSVSTFGFRGEALASISYCSRTTITSKTKDQDCAYKAEYEDGILKNKSQPKACAGLDGTTIRVEDLFFNNITRKKAIKSATETEKMVKMISKIAIHYSGVGISFKRQGDTLPIVSTQKKNTKLENIKVVYSSAVSSKILIHDLKSTKYDYDMSVYMTSVEYASKKFQFILFINNRLVENKTLKKSIQTIYGQYLTSSQFPFVYISLTMIPKNLEVNVHPTKEIVHWLHEDDVCDEIAEFIKDKLVESSGSRVFSTTKEVLSSPIIKTNKTFGKTTPTTVPSSPSSLIRTNDQKGQMERFITPTTKESPPTKKVKQDTPVEESVSDSVSNLKTKSSHDGICKLFKDYMYVGWITPKLSLVQHADKLFMINTHVVSQHLMYELIVKQMGKLKRMKLSSSLSIEKMVLTASKSEEVAKQSQDLFSKQKIREILNDYFEFDIRNGSVCGIPQVLEGYIPPLHRFPDLLLKLSKIEENKWTEDNSFLDRIAHELAWFYSMPLDNEILENGTGNAYNEEKCKYVTEHVIYVALKKGMENPPSTWALDGTVNEIANLGNLFKVFERC